MMSKGLWMSKDAGTLNDGEITFDNISRIEVKRPQHWFNEGSESELVPIKKQALGCSSSNSFAGVSSSSVTSWGNMSGSKSISTQLSERLLDTDTICDNNFDERNLPPVDNRQLIMGRDPVEDISSFGLSTSHSLKDSMFSIDYGGIRKVKVNEVRDSENLMPIRLSNTGEVSTGTTAYDYGKVDNSGFSTVLTYGREDASFITLGESYGRENDNFLSMRRAKHDIGHRNETGSGIMPSILFSKSNTSIISMPENLSKGDCSIISMENPSKDDNMILMSQGYKSDGCISASNNCSYKVQVSSTSTAQSSSKCESHGFSVAHPTTIGVSNIISFGGHHNDASSSGRLICSYDLPMRQTGGQIIDTSKPKDLLVTNANTAICSAQALSTGAENASKRKEDCKSLKSIPLNNFPSNVRSLLSTGILDEVPVKYTAWSREKELHGIIKGSGYLCGCMSCNFSKVINAYEFERHAGCKTKHPNNHIYFDNGKTIYGVVQELRSTPQNMLFDVIQTITGSPINQKSFRLWKESFLAATRELERIYSKDERKQLL